MTEVFTTAWHTLQQMPMIDWLATTTAIFYIFLAARERVSCWYFGIISCGLWAYSSFAYYQLYLDGILNVFYVIMGFVGIYQWKFSQSGQQELPITTLTARQHFLIIIIGVILSYGYGFIFDRFTNAEATYMDAATTVFAIIATFMVIYKKLENWIYWLVVDAVYCYLYVSRGAWLFMLIMILYWVIAWFGYFNWRKKMKI